MFTSSSRILSLSLILVLLMSLLFINPVQPVTAIGLQAPAVTCPIRVNASASPGGDGSSWAKAYNDLQTAITAAGTVAPCQVWVEKGTYKPNGYRLASFYLVNGVAIYGGFAGNETSLSQRSWQANLTILSGDIGTPNDASDNVYNVLWVYSGTNNTAVLDGFTIMDGNANNISDPTYTDGGGVYIDGGSPTLANLYIQNNNASRYGGGVFINGGSPTLSHVIIENNTADYGAGMYLTNHSNVTLNLATFTSNSATTDGGGLFNDSTSTSLILSFPTFDGNHAGHGGGGAYIYGHAVLSWADFDNNTADFGAGLLIISDTGGFSLTKGTFTHNTAKTKGGGAYIYSSSPALTNVYFITNSAQLGGGIGNYSSSPILTNSSFTQNTSTLNGGGIYNSQASHPQVQNSILWGDTGGEVYTDTFYTKSTISISYSLVQGCNPGGVWNPACYTNGGHNLADADPKFVDAAQGNLRLQVNSPAINKGNNAFVSGITTDLDGNPRIFGGVVDLGAYELNYHPLFLPLILRK